MSVLNGSADLHCPKCGHKGTELIARLYAEGYVCICGDRTEPDEFRLMFEGSEKLVGDAFRGIRKELR